MKRKFAIIICTASLAAGVLAAPAGAYGGSDGGWGGYHTNRGCGNNC